jgi:hypothetical protein
VIHRAPCGHVGTPIIGTFVNCTRNDCDGRAADGPRCPICDSKDVAPHWPQGWLMSAWRCSRGHVWLPPVSYEAEG